MLNSTETVTAELELELDSLLELDDEDE